MVNSKYYKLLSQQIHTNIAKHPQKVAYSIHGQTTTFAEMDHMATSIATAIVKELPSDAIDRERPVRIGILLPRDSHFIACILACVKLGCSYVPIDIATPPERLNFILEDSQLDFLINTGNLPKLMKTSPEDCLPCLHKSLSEAYLIYTSGTTGKPKGVSQTYLTIYNYMLRATQPEDFHVTPNSIVLQFASINFDVSVMEIFVSLFAGATCIIAQVEDKQDVKKLYQLLLRENVTFCYLPPSLLAMFPDYNFPAMETLSAGGEAIPHSLVAKIAGHYPFRFVNGYGPTESFYATTYVIPDEAHWRCIGKPVPGVVGYVVDENLQPVQQGQQGELLLGGNQLCNGYWNRPELTERLFFPNPFAETKEAAPRLYHTGDIVQLNADGSFDYMGRADSQVKLRGFRIELEEITTRIESHPRVRRAFTRIEQPGGEQQLVTYVSTEDGNPDLSDIKKYAKQYLPSYMMPVFWNHVDSFQLNINGKIEKSQLKNRAWIASMGSDELMSNFQRILMNEVARIIGVKSVNLDLDLIDEVGLTSLQVMQVPADLDSSGFTCTVDDIYRYRTIRQICEKHLYRISFWYNNPEEHPDRPVIIFVCGYPHFAYNEALCQQFTDTYNVFVIEGFHNILCFEFSITTPVLIELYKLIVRPILSHYHVVAYMGYCFGGEQALALAHDLHNDTDGPKPYVIVVDGEVRRDKDPDHYIALRWPVFTDQQNELRRQLDVSLFSTFPDDDIYNGPVASFLCQYFDEQQAWTPEEQKEIPTWKMDNYRHRFQTAPELWRADYPQADIITIPGSHYTCMHNPECLQIISDYVHKHCKDPL